MKAARPGGNSLLDEFISGLSQGLHLAETGTQIPPLGGWEYFNEVAPTHFMTNLGVLCQKVFFEAKSLSYKLHHLKTRRL